VSESVGAGNSFIFSVKLNTGEPERQVRKTLVPEQRRSSVALYLMDNIALEGKCT
jgi:hypothetical protein